MATVTTDAPEATSSTAIQAPTTGRGRARGRPRGTGRGRGRGRGRGCGRGARTTPTRSQPSTAGRREDPSHRWRISNENAATVMMEDVFVEKVIGERARLFSVSALERIDVERTARDLPDSRTGFFDLFTDEVLRTCRPWLNKHILLTRREVRPVSVSEMYNYMAVLLFSHCTGFSFEKTAVIMPQDGLQQVDVERMKFISNNILAFSPTGRGNHGGISWLPQRDQTQLLTQFERAAYRTTCKMFVSPTHTLATLDDDLYGTRPSDNQVKTISSRKADREGHTADAIADALFRITLMVRFRRRGVTQTSNVSSLLDALLEGRGEQSVHGLVVTAERGYGKLELIEELVRHCVWAILVMPDHVLRCHPFVARSFLNVMRNEHDPPPATEVPDSSGDSQEEQPAGAVQADDEGVGGVDLPPIVADRRRTFIIDDSPTQSQDFWTATKKLRVCQDDSSSPVTRSVVTTVAVRERGTDSYSRVLRFLYNVPTAMKDCLNSWVAVPKHQTL